MIVTNWKIFFNNSINISLLSLPFSYRDNNEIERKTSRESGDEAYKEASEKPKAATAAAV